MKKSIAFMVFMAIIVIILSGNVSLAGSPEFEESKYVPPFFDGCTDSNLKLYSSRVTEYPINWERFEKTMYVPKMYIDKMKSKTMTESKEIWLSKSCSVDITIWRFSYVEDSIIFPYTGLATNQNDPFRGWDKTTTIGDKTYWNRCDYVIFAKGKATVRVFIHGLLTNEQMKEYTRKIAESIAKKL
ncbi:MAG: hypothetical protein AB9903_07465 [Vulcanimicrobiota bacterium]